MKNLNSCLVTGELFLDLEEVIQKKASPSLQTVLALNEILELIVLKEKLLMTSSDHITILKNLNRDKIVELEKKGKIDWEYELKNLGNANLRKPLVSNYLYEKGILILDTEQKEDPEFRHFGDIVFSMQWNEGYLLKSIGVGAANLSEKESHELAYLTSFAETGSFCDPVYWKMAITAWPVIEKRVKVEDRRGLDLGWVYKFYKEVETYVAYARKGMVEFSDSIFMQPFVALLSRPSENFIRLFYEKLKEYRNEEIADLLRLNDSWIYYLPPLSAILIQRCKTLEDIPVEMVKLRKEFEDLRESFSKFQERFVEADLIKDKLELKKDYIRSLEMLKSRIMKPKRRIVKSVVDIAIDESEAFLKPDFVGPVKLIGKKVVEFIYKKKVYPWLSSFADLYEKSVEIKDDPRLFQRLFGDISLANVKEYELFCRNCVKFAQEDIRQVSKEKGA